jgi:hypothetical protein
MPPTVPLVTAYCATSFRLYQHSNHRDYQDGRDTRTAHFPDHCCSFTSYEAASETESQLLICGLQINTITILCRDAWCMLQEEF